MTRRSKWVYIVGWTIVFVLCAAIILTLVLALKRLTAQQDPGGLGGLEVPDIDLGGGGGSIELPDLGDLFPGWDGELPEGGDWDGELPEGGSGGGIPGFSDLIQCGPGSGFPAWDGNLPDWDDLLPGGGGGELPNWSDLFPDWDDLFPGWGGKRPGGTEPGGGEPGGTEPGGEEGGNIRYPDDPLWGTGGGIAGPPILDGSGSIGGNDGDGGNGGLGSLGDGLLDGSRPIETEAVFAVRADKSTEMYFRYMSFGNYIGNGWGDAPEVFSDPSRNYLTSIALGQASYSRIGMELIIYNDQYLMPYYALPDEGENVTVQEGDAISRGDTSVPYWPVCYDYDYLRDGAPPLLTGGVLSEEILYRALVEENYLNVPSGTAAVLSEIIEQQGWEKEDEDLIRKIAEYVRSCAAYNAEYDRSLDEQQDIVAAFLTQYHEGVCRHFASSATLLYRMMGIPARYVVGYRAETLAGEYVNVTADDAHAWVEVYLAGSGWVKVEVTGSDGSAPQTPEPARKITLTSGSLREEYSGKSIAQPVVTVTEGSLLPGHTVTVDVFTGLKYVGKADNVFEGVRILDEDGNNVTALYAVERAYGTLQLDSRPLVITTGSASKEYDGSPLSCTNYTAEGLAEGDQIEIGFAEYTLRGTYQNAITSLRIVNEDGEDVTRNYTIEAVYGTLRVY